MSIVAGLASPSTRSANAHGGAWLQQSDFARVLDNWRQILAGRAGETFANPQYRPLQEKIQADAAQQWSTFRNSDEAERTYLWKDLSRFERDGILAGNFQRLRQIALAYATPGCEFYGDPQVERELRAALIWLKHNVIDRRENISSISFEWTMAVPLNLVDILTLIGRDWPKDVMQEMAALVFRLAPEPDHYGPKEARGANRSWKCRIWVVGAALAADGERLARAREVLSACFELDEGPSEAGFRPDGVFIQHTGVPYNGGYGTSHILDLVNLGAALEGTPLAYSGREKEFLAQVIETHFESTTYEGARMDAFRGREIARPATTSHSRFLVTSALRLAELPGVPRQQMLRSIAKRNLLQDKTYPALANGFVSVEDVRLAVALMNLPGVPPRHELVGFTGMWSGDRVVHRRPGWAAVLAMSSSRTTAWENITGDNLKGWYTGQGMLYLYNADQNAYAGNFWPVVDPYRMPGVTAEAGTRLEKGGSGSRFVGGVTAPSGSRGVACMDIGYSKSPVRGKKAWFFLDREVVCLGAGISTGSGRLLETVVENRQLNATGSKAIQYGAVHSPRPTTEPAAKTSGPEEGDNLAQPQNISASDWVWLQGTNAGADIGYYLPPAGRSARVRMLRDKRTGSWKDIGNGPPTPLAQAFFTLWLEHGPASGPSQSTASPDQAPGTGAGTKNGGGSDAYSYAVLPGLSADETAAYSRQPGYSVEGNSIHLQAVRSQDGNHAGAVFWEAGTWGQGTDAVTVSAPCTVFLEQQAHGAGRVVRLAVADSARVGSPRQPAEITVDLHRRISWLDADKKATSAGVRFESKPDRSRFTFTFRSARNEAQLAQWTIPNS